MIIGLSLLSYAVNLFIFSTGGLRTGAAPILERGAAGDLAQHADPVPQALVLTAIVIGFATTALFLVRAPRRARPDGDRPRGRQGAGALSGWMDHLTIAPIVIPLLAGTLMVLIGERRRTVQGRARPRLGARAARRGDRCCCAWRTARIRRVRTRAAVRVYRLGDWPSLFGIVLVLDRLSALMLVLTASSGLAALVFSLARWHRAGAHFHPLFQFQLMGLNGAFLTGDLFNLFVFFEVMLAASYGLALHGSGIARASGPGCTTSRSTWLASLLFLVGVSMIYGIAGTLNMADLAGRDRRLRGGGPGAAGGRGRDPGRRLPGQGGDVAARLLAAHHLRRGQRPGRGDPLHPEQGRRLRRAAAVAAAVRRASGRLGRLRRRLAAASAGC